MLLRISILLEPFRSKATHAKLRLGNAQCPLKVCISGLLEALQEALREAFRVSMRKRLRGEGRWLPFKTGIGTWYGLEALSGFRAFKARISAWNRDEAVVVVVAKTGIVAWDRSEPAVVELGVLRHFDVV